MHDGEITDQPARRHAQLQVFLFIGENEVGSRAPIQVGQLQHAVRVQLCADRDRSHRKPSVAFQLPADRALGMTDDDDVVTFLGQTEAQLGGGREATSPAARRIDEYDLHDARSGPLSWARPLNTCR